MTVTPAEAVDVAKRRFGNPPHARALHAKGVWVRGTFTAAPAARELCRAAHLQGDPIEVLARFSNGSGDPAAPDFLPDVRGLAVRFELPDGTQTDLLGQSVPRFFSPTPEHFVDFLRANTGRTSPLKLAAFLARNPRGVPSLPANAKALMPVASFATCRFYTVHAFRWEAADGSSRSVRCDWRPEAGEQRLPVKDAKALGPDYLRDELAARLATGPVRFVLDAQLAEAGDPVDDPAQHWPATRRRVDAGTLKLTEVVPDPEAGGALIVFDPVRVTDGITMPADPVLAFRPLAYGESAGRRAAGSSGPATV